MTLIEIMVVVVIAALAISAASMSIGALRRTKLRSSAVKIASAARYAYHRAVTRGSTVRLHFSLEDATMSIEEAHGAITLSSGDDERDGDGEKDEAGVDPWQAARARLEETFEPSFGRSPFAAITDQDGNPIKRYKAKQLEGVRISKIITPHEPEPRLNGKGSIYFFATGKTEHAIVQITDRSSDKVYSVEIDPLTGRGTVHAFALTLDDLEEQMVRDPG